MRCSEHRFELNAMIRAANFHEHTKDSLKKELNELRAQRDPTWKPPARAWQQMLKKGLKDNNPDAFGKSLLMVHFIICTASADGASRVRTALRTVRTGRMTLGMAAPWPTL